MRLFFIFTGVWLLLLSACSSSTGPKPSKSFFPLKTGNKWYYSADYKDTTHVDEIWTVTGQQTLDGKDYFAIQKEDRVHNISNADYYRMHGDTLFIKETGFPERIIADFSIAQNDFCYWDSNATVTRKTNTIFEFGAPFSGDSGYHTIYKKGIGLTRLITNGIIYHQQKLVKAYIK